MQQLQGRVAVITGAASGIGLALAQRFGREGMRLVLADIEAAALARVQAQFQAQGVPALAVQVDVMDEAQVAALADAAYRHYGAVHLLCNNAGVTAPALRAPTWETRTADWQWVLGVNLMGVVHGVRAFVPRMLAGGEPGHIVNTASVAGLISGPGPYFASKHGVVCLSEGLYKDLRAAGAKLSASVLCPGLIRTAILDAERNRAAAFGGATDLSTLPEASQRAAAGFRESLQSGYEPAQVADAVADAVRDDRFYIVPAQAPLVEMLRLRMQDILEGRNPSLPPGR
ncbi:MAG: SDR family NAD(P)-dependent oxidoreductase [Rubrivivax sp.]|nr:SDR family NAD(P)-dependent oxidoreductase [Rubrivivax sp.]